MLRITSFDDVPALAEYRDIVAGDEIASCTEQHQLMDYLARTFRDEAVFFDVEQFDKYMTYQRYFPFELFPWERFVFALHNCAYDETGAPRWADLLLYMGRGGGKNGYISFEDFCLLTPTNGIHEYDIDICANSEDQAETSFKEVYSVVSNPEFSKQMRHNFRWTKTEITNRITNSTLRFRTSNPKTKDGGRQGKVDFDEIHAYENWAALNVFTTGLGKKPEPRTTYATTDGDVRDGPLDQLKERAKSILNGSMRDNGLLPFVCRLDDEKEVHDERMWPKANPSLPYKPELMRRIRTEYQNYVLEPVKNASFMTKRMNMPQGDADTEVTSWKNILKTNRPLPDLRGRACVCGIDYTKTTDFMSAVLLFRDGDTYYAMHHSWFCANSRDRGRIKLPLDEMEARGLLTIVHDVEVQPHYVTDWIDARRREGYQIEKVAADSFRYALLRRSLAQIGFDANDRTVKMVRPSDIMFVQNKLGSIFARGDIIWGDDPMMRWYTNNTKLVTAPNNNFKYEKIEGKSRKTDGFMALVHAFTVEDAIPEQSPEDFTVLPALVFA